MKANRRAVGPAVGAVLLLAFFLRLWRLGDQNLWWDEALAVWAVHKSLPGVTLWTAGDVHPPLFFWTLWSWVRLAGESAFAVRYLTVVWGMLAVSLAYALGKRLAGAAGGLIALSLVGLSRFEVWWSMELRMYMLAGMCVLGATYGLLRWLRQPASTRPLAIYAVFAGAALYTLYMSAAVLVLLNLVAVLTILAGAGSGTAGGARFGTSTGADAGQTLRRWLMVQAQVALAYLPWLAFALPRLSSWRVPGEPASMAFVVQLWTTLLSTGVSTDLGAVGAWVFLWWAAAGIVAVVAVVTTRTLARRASGFEPKTRLWLRSLADRRTRGPLTLVLFLAAAPIIVWAATQPRSIFYSPRVEARYLVPFAGPAYVLVAWGLAKVWFVRPRLAGLLGMAVFGVQLLSLPGHYAARHLRDVTQGISLAIWSQAEAGDAVVLVSGNRYPLFRYDYDHRLDHAIDEELDDDQGPSIPPVVEFPSMGSEPVTGHEGWEEELGAIAGRHQRLWLVELDHELQDPERLVFGWLAQHRRLVLSEAYGPNALHLFDQDGAAPEVTRMDAAWPVLTTKRVFPGDPFIVTLLSESLRPAAEVQISLVDDSGVAVWTGLSQGGHEGQRRRVAATVDERWPGEPRGGAFEVLARPVVNGTAAATWDRLGRVHVSGTRRRLGADSSCVLGASAGPARLCHFAVTRRAVAGGQVTLDLLWNADPAALSALPLTTTVFAHLVGPPRPPDGDRVWAAGDGLPSSGAWSLGRPEIQPRRGLFPNGPIFDRHILALDPSAPPGRYEIEVGLYDPATGTRYPVRGELADAPNRRLVLGAVEVAAPGPVDGIIRNISLLWR